MPYFLNTQTMDFPVYEGDLKHQAGIDDSLLYPDYAVPDGYAVVSILPIPTYDANTETAEWSHPPVLVDGQWVLQWAVRNMTAEELAEKAIFDEQIAAKNAEIAAIMAANSGQPPAVNLVEIP